VIINPGSRAAGHRKYRDTPMVLAARTNDP
jgi:hypothetical protein